MEEAPAGPAPAPKKAPEQVVVHPLVLLSVVDHFNRAAKDTKKRVVGVLLGESYKGRIDVTNSFAGGWRGGWAVPVVGNLLAYLPTEICQPWVRTRKSVLQLRVALPPPLLALCQPRPQPTRTRPAPAPPCSASTMPQFPLRRMTATPPSGSWTTPTWSRCSTCSRRSTVRSEPLLSFGQGGFGRQLSGGMGLVAADGGRLAGLPRDVRWRA